MKTTKTQAKEIYDNFHGILRCLNGGTGEENKRNAPRCFERISKVAEDSIIALENAGKLLRNDEWLFEALQSLPERARKFGEQYGLTGGEVKPEPVKAESNELTNDERVALIGMLAQGLKVESKSDGLTLRLSAIRKCVEQDNEAKELKAALVAIRAAWVRTDNGKSVAMAHAMKRANDLI